ncbi:MAG: DNA glycosylase [Promethearchaeota archaeon]
MSEHKEISRKIIKWGENGNLRDYPWRNSVNHYEILISEILLHRTKADQVFSVYSDFIKKYPNFNSISRTSYDELLKSMKSLGLTWRVKKLHCLSKEIVELYNGVIPLEQEELIKLPGIGEYISGAFLICALNKKIPLLDTNIVRIISRVYSLPVTDSSRRNRKYRELIDQLIDEANPRLFLYSIIDLASLVCKPSDPRCTECPILDLCNYAKINY